ncbi:hypothetical protein [Mesorhizobium sp. M0579]|uniref:hypothetical protein n=1 Tax=Mesorhizobium sp. M0579 TaxID=2956962 RepID=UPI0033364626
MVMMMLVVMMLVVMMLVVMVPPPPGLVVVLVMVVMMAVSGGRLDGTGERAVGEEDGDQARSKNALQHDDLLDRGDHSPLEISCGDVVKGSKALGEL